MSNAANEHAIRIWLLPREQWRQELQALPEVADLNGVKWPLRKAVIQRLLLAEKLERASCCFAGWPTREG